MSDTSEEIIVKKASKPPTKKQAIEQIYQKKSQLEHILLRPDSYIGSVEKTTDNMWVYDFEKKHMVEKSITYVPGLYKIFDEILVNAADNKQRDRTMDCIKIDIDQSNETIKIWNNGQGIPVVKHKEENMFVPTMIFGHLLTSSNYNDEEEKVTGGRNGYGAKLCNIFSTEFIVETSSKEYGKQFKQTWRNNMSTSTPEIIKDSALNDFTRVTFKPDLSKFKMDRLDDDIIALMSRRAFDVAASSRGVKVFLNGDRLPIGNFKDYVDLYLRSQNDDDSPNEKFQIVHENVNERWEVAIARSDNGFRQVSFVNSIATTKGGKHVDYICDMIIKGLLENVKKKNKGGTIVKPHQVKVHLWIFVNCLVVNPTFDSQTKENMTLQAKQFGSKCALSEKFMTSVNKIGIVESVLSWAKFKEQTELQKKSGTKKTKLKGVPKLEDANDAGTKNSYKCTLILTEGDSAKALAVAGLSVIGRDHYGVFPLRGKVLNVREATHKQILENPEINNIVKIMGLIYKKKYMTFDDIKTLRYGKMMIMTDQDQDGSHIKGLLINFVHYNWPSLLKMNFIEEFITPIVKARKKNEELSFFSIPEFQEWMQNTENYKTYNIKYYKGLGTSTSNEAREYFRNIDRHRITFQYTGTNDDEQIEMAFSKKDVEKRKEWLTNFMTDSKQRKIDGLPDKYLYEKNTRHISYADFINLELIHFSNMDNVRSIPCMIDGLKPGQRKILYTILKMNIRKEIKLVPLSGMVTNKTAYHHGETSLNMAIINMAQNFVGSNNINLLLPIGQFGTRMEGGKDAAAYRYIFTKLSPLARLIFHPKDDPILIPNFDDNKRVEPKFFVPIIPMVMVNGAEGIGTGWSTKILNYNPKNIINSIRQMIDGNKPDLMSPWYRGFAGTIERVSESRFVVSGEISIVDDDVVEITELPVGTWTIPYRQNILEPLLHGSEKVKPILTDFKDYSSETKVRFIVTFMPGELRKAEKEGLHKLFKLQNMLSTSNMCAFDEHEALMQYDTIFKIFNDFYVVRLDYYQKRKDYLLGILEAEALRLKNQARFILEKCSGEVVVENLKRAEIIRRLKEKSYDPDPVMIWKESIKKSDIGNAIDEEDDEEDDDEEEDGKRDENGDRKDKPRATAEESDVKKFDYLVGMAMWMLTNERKEKLLKERDDKIEEFETLKKKSPKDLWKEDLDVLEAKMNEMEEQEKKELVAEKKKDTKKGHGKDRFKTEPKLEYSSSVRVMPEISEEMKKKAVAATKVSNKRKKGDIKEENVDDIKEEVKSEFQSPQRSSSVDRDVMEISDGNEDSKKSINSPKTSKKAATVSKKAEKKPVSSSSSSSSSAKKIIIDSDSESEFAVTKSNGDAKKTTAAKPRAKTAVKTKRPAASIPSMFKQQAKKKPANKDLDSSSDLEMTEADANEDDSICSPVVRPKRTAKRNPILINSSSSDSDHYQTKKRKGIESDESDFD